MYFFPQTKQPLQISLPQRFTKTTHLENGYPLVISLSRYRAFRLFSTITVSAPHIALSLAVFQTSGVQMMLCSYATTGT